jgi:hypothetical protein
VGKGFEGKLAGKRQFCRSRKRREDIEKNRSVKI